MKKLILVVTEDKWVLTHRLPLAKKAAEQGYSVVVVTRVTKYKEEIERHGIRVIPSGISRGELRPLDEIKAILELVAIYKKERPAVVHHIGIKNILYGGLAARIVGVGSIVNAFAGLGFVYTSDHWKAALIRPILNSGLRRLHSGKGVRVIFQNPDDLELLKQLRVVRPGQSVLIRGSGVDLDHYSVVPEPFGVVTVVMAGRLLWDKGVGVYAEAGRLLKKRGVAVRLQLVGAPDTQNPSSVNEEQLRNWVAEECIEWIGYSENMPEIWAKASIAALPSFYGEGVPKSLLEAAACGCPLIATDSPGCREIVLHKENGILIPIKDPESLADAIELLVNKPQLRAKMGCKSRKIVEDHFSDKLVASRTVAVYQQLTGQE